MYRVLLPSAYAVTLLAIISPGCTGNPASPGAQPASEPPGLSASASAATTHHCLGFGLLAIDTESVAVDVLPGRSGDWHFNLTGVLNTTMGVSAAMVPGESDPANGLFVLDITLTHPFGAKLQLSGFDVKGVLMTPGTLALGPLMFGDADETRLENADGYTRWWNPTEFILPGILGYTEGNLAIGPTSALTATVNPYKLFADILGAEDPLSLVSDEPLGNDQGRAVFTAGSSNTRRYRIRFPVDPGQQVVYGYAIDCAWNPPDPIPPDEIPDDFPIEANQPEAFRVGFVPTANTLYYDSESGVAGGVLRFQINVHDWQGQYASDIAAEINAVRIFAPDLMAGGADGVFLNETSTKARYTADLTGLAAPTEAGETLIICQVGSSDGSTYRQTGAPAPDSALSAFQVIDLDIPDPECTGDANNDWLEAVEIGFGDPIADQVCLPDDYRDFFFLNLPPGYDPTGEIRLYCDAEPTTLGLYDDSHALITEADVSGGLASIAFDGLDLLPGQYFIRVLTSNSDQVAPYLLELAGELENVIPSDPVEVTPPTLYVDPNRVWLHDNYAFLTAYGVWVYDISDPANPVQLTHEQIRVNEDACFHYPYLYFNTPVGGDALQVNMIDFTDPTAPVLHEDLIHYMTYPADIAMNSTYLYVGTSVQPDSEVMIFEYATDPLNPTQVASITVPHKPHILELMDPEGPETRLVVGTWDYIYTFDVEDPSSITPTGLYDFGIPPPGPRSMITRENYIYLGISDAWEDGRLYVMTQHATSISYLGHVDVPGSTQYIALEWPHVYFGDGLAGLTICDVTTPSTPTHVSSTTLVSFGADLTVDNDTVFIIPKNAGLQVMDVSTPLTPVPIARLPVVNSACSVLVKDGYLLVADMGSGAIKTLDISDPTSANVVAEYFPPDLPTDFSLYGDVLAASGGLKKWMLFDASDPLDILPYSSATETHWVDAIGIYGNAIYVYVDKTGHPVRIYEISDPYSPHYKKTMSFSNLVRDFTFIGDYMYVATGADIEVYSITDPFNPTLVDTYSHSSSGYNESEIQGDYLYLITDETLEIADISSPSSPVHTGSELIPDPGSGYDVITVEGQFGYVAGYSTPPYSCWIFPPDDPTALGPIYDHNIYGVRDLLVHQGFLYEGTEGIGLHIFDLY